MPFPRIKSLCLDPSANSRNVEFGIKLASKVLKNDLSHRMWQLAPESIRIDLFVLVIFETKKFVSALMEYIVTLKSFPATL